MDEKETKFYIDETGFNGTIGWFSDCVSKVELYDITSTPTQDLPDWIPSSGTNIINNYITMEISPLLDGEDNRSCTLSAITFDEDNEPIIIDPVADSAYTSAYTLVIIQKRRPTDIYELPEIPDYESGKKCECTVSCVSGGEEKEDGKYHIPSTGGIASFNSSKCNQGNNG